MAKASGPSSRNQDRQQPQPKAQATSDDQTVPAGLLDAVIRDAERKLGTAASSSAAAGTPDSRQQHELKGKGKQQLSEGSTARTAASVNQDDGLAAVGREGTTGRSNAAVLEVHE